MESPPDATGDNDHEHVSNEPRNAPGNSARNDDAVRRHVEHPEDAQGNPKSRPGSGVVGRSGSGDIQSDGADATPDGGQLTFITHAEYQEITQEASYHQGPLPSPDMLREYQEIDPSLLPTIIEMARVDSIGRHEVVKELASAEATGVRIIAWTTAIMGIGGLASAVAFGILGIESGVIGSLVSVGLVGVAKVASSIRSKPDD